MTNLWFHPGWRNLGIFQVHRVEGFPTVGLRVLHELNAKVTGEARGRD
jgi:hypothetical protein